MWRPNGCSLRPRPRRAGSSRATQAILNLRKITGDPGPPSQSASGWIEKVELSILGIAWCLARVTGKIATKYRFAGDPNAPMRLKIRADGLRMVPGRARRNRVRVGKTIGADITCEACTRLDGPISCIGVID